MDIQKYLQEWEARYKADLTENIMPFWLKFGLDRENGGVYTCVDRDGTLYDTTKSVWFQGRYAYVCSLAYNKVEKRQEYLDAARITLEFIDKYCFDTDGRMYFEISADGVPLRKRRYVFSESFAVIAMAEYAKATGDKYYARRAMEVFNTMRRALTSGELEPKYLPAVKAQGHSITMIMMNVAHVLKALCDDPVLDQQIEESVSAIGKYFMHPEYKALLEMVGPNGEFIDTINGRTINPGHCIETSWFLMDIAEEEHNDELMTMALQILDWSLDWGWDEQYGGIINFRDCRNFPPQDYSQDMKFWWPHCEGIIATLYAYKVTGDEKYLEWHKKISDWTYAHFPDAEYGEWYGYLHRDGTVAQPAKGNIFKGPFHIPRMMITASSLCKQILEK